MDLFEYAENQSPEEDASEEGAHQIEEKIYSVGQLTGEIKSLIRSCFGQDGIWVKGELSNFRGRNQSGHMYFSLKDDRAVLGCVFFRGSNRNLTIDLKEGQEVLAFGRIDLYEPHGKYQMVVEEIRPGGVGELYLKFEQLKKKLEAEGLFDPEKKKSIPEFPEKIGLVTSSTGAVIRDIIHVTRRRFPHVQFYLVPVRVQGDGAAGEIAKAIENFNRFEPKMDCLIVGRGGGSIEDLWAFNEEDVARAIFASHIPVISAVGHQTDTTIADFVADVRAATPSQAAEIAVPDGEVMQKRAQHLMRQVLQNLSQSKNMARQRLDALKRSAPLRDPRTLIHTRTQRVDLATERMSTYVKRKQTESLERWRRSLDKLKIFLPKFLGPRKAAFQKAASNLDLLSPLAILSRGYSVVRNGKGEILKTVRNVKVKEDVNVRLHEGEMLCQIKKILKGS